MTQLTNNKLNKKTKPITLEQTVQKVKELNKEVKGLKELLHSIMTHIKHTYGNIQDIANVLNAADIEHIPDDKHEKIKAYKDKLMKED
jgi:archaellum component FlaC